MALTMGRRAIRWITAVTAVIMLTASLTAPTTASARATRDSGYSINAKPGWIGGYKMRGKRVYRTTASKPVVGKYRPVKLARKSPARARAAWILSKYGARGSRTQAAAVDAAVLHLLAGKAYRLNGSKGAARIRQVGGDRGYVRSYARQMLTNARAQSGPYRTKLTGPDRAVAGSGAKLTFTIRSRSGNGVFGLPVVFTYGDGARVTAYTNRNGVASATVTVQAGVITARAAVSKVPDWRLRIRKAKRRASSAVAIAGHTSVIRAKTSIIGTTTQTVRVSNRASRIMVGQVLGGSYTITGGAGAREVRRTVYGPASTSAAGCVGSPAFSSSTTTSTSSSWPLPSYKPTRSGYYRWGVYAGASISTPAASTCGAPVKVQRRASISQARPDGMDQSVPTNRPFGVNVRVSGFDRWETHQAIGRVYGPFETREAARCVEARKWRTVNRTIKQDGTYALPRVTAGAAMSGKFFIWQSSLSTGELILGNNSACGVIFKIVQ